MRERRATPGARSAATPPRGSPPPATPPRSPSPAPSPVRLAALDLGQRAEQAARAHLLALGYEILGANVRVGRLEIDLIAREEAVVVVVEVRARGPGSLVRPLDTIDGRKRARLRAAARGLWRDRFARDPRFERLRFDCVAVTIDEAGGARIEHVRAAF